MSEPDQTRITIEQRYSDQDATFIATKHEEATVVTADGPVPMVLDQIVIDPSDYSGDTEKYCGVSLNYTRTSKYHTRLGTHIVIPPEEEARLVEWLHVNGADFIIETPEFRSESIEESGLRGRCEECGEYFRHHTEWGVTLHQENDHDLHFCSVDCFQNWN